VDCKDVFNQLPMEFAVEADRLLSLAGRKRWLIVGWASCPPDPTVQKRRRDACATSAEEEKRDYDY